MDSLSKIILIIISSFLFSKIPVMGLDLRQITENTKEQKQELSKESYMPIVRILTPASSGSGVVLGRKNNIYTLITAKHVIQDYLDNQKDEIEIKIAPNIFIKPLEVIIPFENKDIAFLKFHSVSYIKLAILPFLDKPLWDKVSDWESINVQGFANESFGVKEATFRKASGKLLTFLEKNVGGYNLIHTSVTTTGMSGGGIFSDDIGFIYREASPRVVDPEANPLIYYYDSTKELGERIKKHSEWKDKNNEQFVYLRNFTEPFWDEKIHSNAQNATYKKCMTNKWKPKEEILQRSDREFFWEFPYSELKLGDPEISKQGLWLRCTDLAFKSDIGYNCKAFKGDKSDKDMYLLLAIHGRAEKYVYGGKSGAGLGIFLGQKEIAKWLEKNSKKFGIKQNYSFAKRFCSHK